MRKKSKRLSCVLISLVLLLAVTGCGDKADEKKRAIETENTPPVLAVLTPTLLKMYKTNPLRAEEQFEGKVIIVGGIPKEVGRYEKTPDWLYLIFTGDYGGNIVKAQFRDVHANDLKNVKTGQGAITVKGRCWLDKTRNEIVIDHAKIVPATDVMNVKFVE